MARVRLSPLVPITAFVLCALSSGACAKVHARTIGPALETPEPPARIVPTATPPIESQPIVATPGGEIQAPTPPLERIPSTTTRAPEVAAPAPPPATPPPAPAPTLQTTANPAAGEQRTRASLANATRDLGRIDVRLLGPDARAQYDIARRFVTQATDALNAKKFEFAQQLADKAETLAALLQKR